MRKFIVQSSWFVVNIFLALFVLSLLTTNYQLPTIYAQESTPSSDIKAKLEELKKNIASKAAQIKTQVNLKLQNKAYVGLIKTATTSGTLEGSVTIAADTGPKIVTLNQDTIYESKIKGKKVSLKTLAEENYIAALGDVDDNGVLTAKKLILITPPTEGSKTYFWGQVISMSDSLITLKNKEGKTSSVSTSSTTTLTNGNEEIKYEDLKISGAFLRINDYLIVSGINDKNEVLKATFVYKIPQGDILKSKISSDSAKEKEATKSSKTATPSAKPTR